MEETKEEICSRIGPILDDICREYTELSQTYSDLEKRVSEEDLEENIAGLEALEARLQPWISMFQGATES